MESTAINRTPSHTQEAREFLVSKEKTVTTADELAISETVGRIEVENPKCLCGM